MSGRIRVQMRLMCTCFSVEESCEWGMAKGVRVCVLNPAALFQGALDTEVFYMFVKPLDENWHGFVLILITSYGEHIVYVY